MAERKATRAENAIAWIEAFCRVPEGRNVGTPLTVAPFMRDDLKAIYDNPNGTRRAIISRARKNAKTTEAALILLLHLCGPEYRANSQLFSAAQSRDQAAILFALASKMVRMSPDLAAAITIRDTKKELFCPDLGTTYRALAAEASTAYGLSPSLIVHDELGQVKGPRSDLYEALETATAAQADPLSIVISTQAPTDGDLLSLLIDDAKAGHDPRTTLRFQSADIEMDPFSEEAIRAANPAFDVFMNKREVMAMAEDARRMPSREAEYRNLILNQRVEASNPFISRGLWKACGTQPTEDLRGLPIYGGLDLSEVNDLTALVLMAPLGGVWHVRPTFWLPGEGLRERSRADRVPYDLWARDGFLTAIDGASSIEYEYVAAHLWDLVSTLDVRKIAFDRWNFKHLKPWLLRVGFSEAQIEDRFVEFGQGFASMSPALRDLEGLILNQKIAHGDHPVLTMCAANAVVQKDPAGNRKLTKDKSRGRIDGMIALVMAAGVAGSHIAEPELDIMAMIG